MPMASTVRTDGLAVTLAMSRGELRTLLADNTDLVSGLFATLSSAPPGVSGTIQSTAAAADLGQLAASGLTPVEKVLALQRVPLFARVAADEMRQLADVAQAVTLQRGATAVRHVCSGGVVAGAVGRDRLEGEWPGDAADHRPRRRSHRLAGSHVGAIARTRPPR